MPLMQGPKRLLLVEPVVGMSDEATQRTADINPRRGGSHTVPSAGWLTWG